jgi:holo-[acyl-carrier protein] synthase
MAPNNSADSSPRPAVGFDLLEIERMERALERRPALAERLFTAGELAYSRSQGRPAQHLAARFCAKEAVTKALGLRAMVPHDVEVLAGGAAVALRLHGAAQARAEELGVEVSVSLTHSSGLAGAVAVIG